MTDQTRWLSKYAANGSHDAFAALVGAYIDIVYAAARRQVGDAHLAEDVTQAVFIVLAQKAKLVDPGRPLLGWLLKTTSYCAANARRAQAHRETHERKAGEMANSINGDRAQRESDWQELAPLLDAGL